MWAAELWPYVNGKALMSMNGLSLRDMEASEMLDVIHYIMEEDLTAHTEVELSARSMIRENLYNSLYGVTYKYPVASPSASFPRSNTSQTSANGDPLYDDLEGSSPLNPREQEVKPYIPPTPYNQNSPTPFGADIEILG